MPASQLLSLASGLGDYWKYVRVCVAGCVAGCVCDAPITLLRWWNRNTENKNATGFRFNGVKVLFFSENVSSFILHFGMEKVRLSFLGFKQRWSALSERCVWGWENLSSHEVSEEMAGVSGSPTSRHHTPKHLSTQECIRSHSYKHGPSLYRVQSLFSALQKALKHYMYYLKYYNHKKHYGGGAKLLKQVSQHQHTLQQCFPNYLAGIALVYNKLNPHSHSRHTHP